MPGLCVFMSWSRLDLFWLDIREFTFRDISLIFLSVGSKGMLCILDFV